MKSSAARCSITNKSCFCALLGLCMLAGCGKKQVDAESPAPVTPALNPHSVTIKWEPSKSRIAGYNVYRALPNDKPAKLTDGIVLGTDYTDTSVEAGRTYIYYVTSVDPTGLEGVSSKGVVVKVPETETTPATTSGNH